MVMGGGDDDDDDDDDDDGDDDNDAMLKLNHCGGRGGGLPTDEPTAGENGPGLQPMRT